MRQSFTRPAGCWFLGLALTLTPFVARAGPVNAERVRSTHSKLGWTGSTDVGLGYSRGNVDRIDVQTSAGLQWQKLHPQGGGWGDLAPPPQAPAFFEHRWLIVTQLRRVRVSDSDVINSGFAHTRYTWMIIPRLGPEVFAQAQYNELTLLRSRMLLGGGARVSIINRIHASAWAGSGYMAEHEVNATVPGDPHPARVLNHRWTSYAALLLSFAEQRVLLQNAVYVQPRFDALGDLRVLHALQFQGKMTEVLSVVVDLQSLFDSRPPQTVERLDISLTTSFRISFE